MSIIQAEHPHIQGQVPSQVRSGQTHHHIRVQPSLPTSCSSPSLPIPKVSSMPWSSFGAGLPREPQPVPWAIPSFHQHFLPAAPQALCGTRGPDVPLFILNSSGSKSPESSLFPNADKHLSLLISFFSHSEMYPFYYK